MAFVKHVARPKPNIDLKDRPTREQKYEVFGREGKATDADVIEAFGQAYVDHKIESFIIGDTWHFDTHCYWIGDPPMRRPRAKIAAYDYFKEMINGQRKSFSRKRAYYRGDHYDGDPDSPSPLNPNRPRNLGAADYEDTFGFGGTRRALNPFIL